MLELREEQLKAIEDLKNGSILCGGVGSGKSLTAIGYYLFKVCEGNIPHNGGGAFTLMKEPRDLYIITTAKKRDTGEWLKELGTYWITSDPKTSHSGVEIKIDSWNNIKKYSNVLGAMFIFDEQRLVGSGAWVKAFYKIAKKNQWILLTATPGDVWSDYIPVFVANGFYKNKTEFSSAHCIYSRYAKFPKIERYVGEKYLRQCRDSITVIMKDKRLTQRVSHDIIVDYDKDKFNIILTARWNPFDNEPIEECSKWYYLQRRVVNSDESRLVKIGEILKEHPEVIIFYNYTYELEMLREYLDQNGIRYSEWNGQKHEDLPDGDNWVYLVQYSAGCEGWNCVTTDTIIFFSQNYSYRVMEQAAGRIDRINTPFKFLHYYHLRSLSPIDRNIHRRLKIKKSFNEDRKAFESLKEKTSNSKFAKKTWDIIEGES